MIKVTVGNNTKREAVLIDENTTLHRRGHRSPYLPGEQRDRLHPWHYAPGWRSPPARRSG